MQTNEKKDIKESLRKNRVEQAEINRLTAKPMRLRKKELNSDLSVLSF